MLSSPMAATGLWMPILGRISDSTDLALSLAVIPGVVEHGLFVGLASTAVLAGASGIRIIERPSRRIEGE